MKTFDSKNKTDSFWIVPETKIGPISIPRLYLGDHGFLQQYGSQLSIDEISQRMQYALKSGSLGLAAGDERCLRAARLSLKSNESNNALLYHTDLRLISENRAVEFPRAMRHLFDHVSEASPEKATSDPVVGKFLSQYAQCQKYDANLLCQLDLDRKALIHDAGLIAKYQPSIVTVGGDYLDFAIAVGRPDLIQHGVEYYRKVCAPKGILLFVTLYLAVNMIRESMLSPDLYDGLMTPINPMGYGMLPSKEELLSHIKELNKPILAMHILASGNISPEQGLAYVFNECDVALAITGASQYKHITKLLKVGREILGDGE